MANDAVVGSIILHSSHFRATIYDQHFKGIQKADKSDESNSPKPATWNLYEDLSSFGLTDWYVVSNANVKLFTWVFDDSAFLLARDGQHVWYNEKIRTGPNYEKYDDYWIPVIPAAWVGEGPMTNGGLRAEKCIRCFALGRDLPRATVNAGNDFSKAIFEYYIAYSQYTCTLLEVSSLQAHQLQYFIFFLEDVKFSLSRSPRVHTSSELHCLALEVLWNALYKKTILKISHPQPILRVEFWLLRSNFSPRLWVYIFEDCGLKPRRKYIRVNQG